jgi:hypothetical protein
MHRMHGGRTVRGKEGQTTRGRSADHERPATRMPLRTVQQKGSARSGEQQKAHWETHPQEPFRLRRRRDRRTGDASGRAVGEGGVRGLWPSRASAVSRGSGCAIRRRPSFWPALDAEEEVAWRCLPTSAASAGSVPLEIVLRFAAVSYSAGSSSSLPTAVESPPSF